MPFLHIVAKRGFVGGGREREGGSGRRERKRERNTKRKCDKSSRLRKQSIEEVPTVHKIIF